MFWNSRGSGAFSDVMTRYLPVRLCRLIGHRRSRRRAYIDPDEHVWASYCRRCGTPLTRHGTFGWRDRTQVARARALIGRDG